MRGAPHSGFSMLIRRINARSSVSIGGRPPNGRDGQNETKQPDHSASLGDSITASTRIRFSVHTGRGVDAN